MSYSFKKKIKILRKILNNYKKYVKNCTKIECRVEYDYMIIEKFNHDDEGKSSVKIPITDIDLTIIRYRSLLHQKKKK